MFVCVTSLDMESAFGTSACIWLADHTWFADGSMQAN